MSTSANSSSWVRTYTRDDATKYQIAYRSNNTWKVDANGRQCLVLLPLIYKWIEQQLMVV